MTEILLLITLLFCFEKLDLILNFHLNFYFFLFSSFGYVKLCFEYDVLMVKMKFGWVTGVSVGVKRLRPPPLLQIVQITPLLV